MPGRFCGECGQERRSLRVAFHRIVGEGIAESFSLDSRIMRTLAALVLRPGRATAAYLAGKRASQTSPIKLYLLLSFLYFVLAAAAPARIDFGAEGTSDSALMRVSAEDLRELRELGGVWPRVADRLEVMARLPQEELQRRVSAVFAENAPRVMFFLVPVLALLLRLAYVRSGFYFAEHVVVALHVHAVAFLLLIPCELSGRDGVTNAGMLAAAVHGAAAMHRVYGGGWASTLARAAGVSALYLVALVAAVAAAAVVAVMTA